LTLLPPLTLRPEFVSFFKLRTQSFELSFSIFSEDFAGEMAPKQKQIASSSGTSPLAAQMGGAPPAEAPISGKNGFRNLMYSIKLLLKLNNQREVACI